MNNLDFGSWICCGDGLITRNIYSNGVRVGHQDANNGQAGYEAGEFEPVINLNCSPNYLTCRHCGEIITEIDDKYCDEYPNSSDIYYDRLREEHWTNDCPENPRSLESKWRNYEGTPEAIAVREKRAANKPVILSNNYNIFGRRIRPETKRLRKK